MSNTSIKYVIMIIALQLSVTSFAAEPDSIRYNIEDFNYLTQFTETNLTTYPYIIKYHSKEYEKLKKDVRKRITKGEVMETAACDYVFWFFSQFDTHFFVGCHQFWNKYDSKVHANYSSLMDYDPQPVCQAVDSTTFLVRVPSCTGKNPSFQWVDSAATAYKNSNCSNLIIDIRGNTGGDDGIWTPFINMLVDHKPAHPWNILFRNTKKNMKIIAERGMDDLAKRAKNTNSPFIPVNEGNEEDEEIPPVGNPVKMAVIVDSRTASSAETLVSFVRDYCSHGKIYGHDNTSGANKTGNVAEFKLPHSGVTCYYPTCVNDDFEQQAKTKQLGIAPDVRITIPLPSSLKGEIDSWTVWVAHDLNNKKNTTIE